MREKLVPQPTELIKRQEVLKGESLNQVAVRLGLPVVLLKKYADELLGNDSSLADWYDPQQGIMSPEMMALVEVRAAYINKRYRERKFWTANRLAEELKKDYRAIQREAKKYRAEHPEWFVNLRHTRGSETGEHYRIELVKKIREFFSKMKKLEAGAFETSKSKFKTEPAMARTMRDMMQIPGKSLEDVYNRLMAESATSPGKYSEKELRQAYEYLKSNNRSA